MEMTLKVCFLSAPTLSGWRNSLPPSTVCFTALAPGTTAPSTAVVRKMRLPQTIGDECERPSIAVFHLMFLVGVHSDGRFFSFEMPEPSGPRHCGQFPASGFAAVLTQAHTNTVATQSVNAIVFTLIVPLFSGLLFIWARTLLCATSVSSVSLWCVVARNSSTTETQRTQRLHRETNQEFLCKAIWAISYCWRLALLRTHRDSTLCAR